MDCCHLPEISVTDDEARKLRALYEHLEEPAGTLDIRPQPGQSGWNVMYGPCSFRREHRPPAHGGCRIYEDRPGTCRVFICQFLRELRIARRQP